jgi:hypothetical protein
MYSTFRLSQGKVEETHSINPLNLLGFAGYGKIGGVSLVLLWNIRILRTWRPRSGESIFWRSCLRFAERPQVQIFS